MKLLQLLQCALYFADTQKTKLFVKFLTYFIEKKELIKVWWPK